MGRAKRKVFRPIFGRDLTSSTGRRTQERVDNTFRAAQQLYDINAEKYRDAAIRNLRDSDGFEGLNEAERQIAIDKEIANIMPKKENPFADFSSNPETEGAIQQDEKRAKAKGDDYSLLDKAEVWTNASMNKLLANTMQSVKAGSDVIRGAHDYFFSGNDVSPNRMLSEAVKQEGKGAFYNIFGVGNRYLAETAEIADRTIQSADASLASRGMDSGFWHAASDMIGQWGFTYGGMGTAALGRLGGSLFSGLGKFSKSVTAAARWAKASEYTRKAFSAGSLFYGALSEAAIESYGVSKTLEEAKDGQLAQLRDMMQKDFDQDFYSYEKKYGAIKFSDYADSLLAASNLDPKLKREVAGVLSGQNKNASPNAIAAADAIVSQYKKHAEEAILQNVSDEIDQRNGLASGWSAGLNTFILTFLNKYTYELATDKLAGTNRLKKAGRLGALGSTLINATTEGIEEVVQGGISKGAENIGKRSVDEMLRASTISERNSTSIGVLGSLGEIAKGMWNTATSASPWVDEALPAIVSTLLMPMYKGSKIGPSESHRTDAFGDARQEKKSWLSRLYDESPIGISGIERYRNYKYSGGKQRTADEAIEAMTKMIKGRHDDLTKEEKRVMTEIFGQNYAEVVHETYQSVVDAMSSADRMNALLAQISQTSSDSADTAVAEELAKAHNVATMLSVIGNSSIGQANFNKRNFSQWSSDLMRSTREFGADMGHAISSFFGANTEAKEARYQAAVTKRDADKAAREEARRAESDPFADVPDNLRPFLNFLDVKETDEATLVSIARQRIENTLDPEEKQKMQEAYFQGEGSDKLTEKAIKDIAGEINKQKHTLADIATDYSKVRTFFDLTTKAGEFSGREKSRIAAAASSFNHLRRLSIEHMDAFEREVAGVYKGISESLDNRITQLLKDREAMRENYDSSDDEAKKSRLEESINMINIKIEDLEKRKRDIEERSKKKESWKKLNFANALGEWDEFMSHLDNFDDLNRAYINAALYSDNDELATTLSRASHYDTELAKIINNAKRLGWTAAHGAVSLNKLIADKQARERLAAEATRREVDDAEQEGKEIINSGEAAQNADEAANAAAENGATDVASAIRQGAEEAQDKGEGESGLSKYRSAVHEAIMKTLSKNEKFMQILQSYGIEGDAAIKFIKDFIYLSDSLISEDDSDRLNRYKDAIKSAIDLIKYQYDSVEDFFDTISEELADSVGEWMINNLDLFPDNPMESESVLPSNPSRPNSERTVDPIEFNEALQRDVESVSFGGVTILKSRILDRIQDLLGSDNAFVDLLLNGNGDLSVGINFENGYATIYISIITRFGSYNSSARIGLDDLSNRLQTDVSLSTLASDIVDVILDANEKSLRDILNSSSEDYKNRDEKSKREQEDAGKDQHDDNTPLTNDERTEVKTSRPASATTSKSRSKFFNDVKNAILGMSEYLNSLSSYGIKDEEAVQFTERLVEYIEDFVRSKVEAGRPLDVKETIKEAIETLTRNGSASKTVLGSINEEVLDSIHESIISNMFNLSYIAAPSPQNQSPEPSKPNDEPTEPDPDAATTPTPTAPPASTGGGATIALPKVESLTLWDAYNPGLNEANLTSLDEEWQERIRKWYEEKNIGLNLKNAKGKEIFFGFAEELSEDGNISNSPLVIYVKDEQEQFVPIGLLPSKTSGNTQALINNARVMATEDKKFNIFSSSDLNAPKATVSKVKYSDFNREQVVGKKTVNAQTIENAVEEELKREQVAISVTAFPGGENNVQYSITTHNDSLAEESKDAINALLTEKKNFLKENYGQTYFVVITNGKNGPKPILVGVKGKNSFVELIQGNAGESEASSLANEYMDKLAKKFDEAKANGTNGVGVSISVDPDKKYVHEFGDSFVRSIRIEEEGKIRIFFSKRLYDSENPTALMDVDVVLDQNLKTTKEQLAEAIVRAMKAIGIDERRMALSVNIMGNKDKVEFYLKRNMRMTDVRSEAGFEALSDGAVDEEGNETIPEPVSPPEGPEGTQPTATSAPRVSEAVVGKSGESDGLFGSATEESLDKIKDKLAEDLANQGYDTVVKSSTSPHIAATQNGRIYMFEINAVDGSYKRAEWSNMHPTLKADAFALINSAQASDFKVSDRGRLFEYGDELSGTTHTIVIRRSTKGASTGGEMVESGSNADRVIALAGKKKHEIAEAIKTEATLRGLILELAAKGVTSSTPLYFSQHTINSKTYGGGHKVILQAKDENGNLHSVEVEIDNELGAQMDKIASVVRERSVKKVAEGFAMISDVKMKDPNKRIITGEADVVFFRNDEGQTQAIVSDVKSVAIPSKDSSPAAKIKEKEYDGVRLIEKYKDQVGRYENHIKSLSINIAEQGYLIAVGYSTIDNEAVVEEASLKSEDIKVIARKSRRRTKDDTGSSGDPSSNRDALLPFERGDVFKEIHEVARLLPQGSLYQALRIYTGVAEVAPGIWGRYRDGIIEVASGASAGTLYHEAMHFIYEKLLTDADRGMLVSGLSEVTEEQIREIFGNQIPIVYARDVRELSAELFRLWMQTKSDKKSRKTLEEKITKLAPKKKGFWGRLQALWGRIKASLGYTPKSSIVSVLTGIEGGNYSHVSVASRVNATNLSSVIEGAVESMLRYGLMSEDDFNNAYNPSSIMASRNMAQLVSDRFMAIAYNSLKVLEEGLEETEHAGRVRRMEATFDDAVAVLRDASEFSEDAMHAVEIIDELGLDGSTRTLQEMDPLEERTDNLLGQTLAGCR